MARNRKKSRYDERNKLPEGVSRAELDERHVLRGMLKPFSDMNVEAKIVEEVTKQTLLPDSRRYLILRPWGDPSVNIAIPPTDVEADDVISALNSVRLLHNFSAILHVVENKVEFIFDTFAVGGEQHTRYTKRKFQYLYRGGKIACKFAPASEQLLRIAGAVETGSFETKTEYRNLLKVKPELWRQKQDREVISFWIQLDAMDLKDLPDLARSLNVDMSRYDRETPLIVVHDPKLYRDHSNFQEKKPQFPATIESSDLDEIVDYFWLSIAKAKDPGSRLLNSFRVIEYYSSSYADEEKRNKIVSLHEDAVASGDMDKFISSVTQVVYAGNDKKDHIRRRKLVDDWVKKEDLFSFIKKREDLFSKVVKFEGGLEIHPIISKSQTQRDWRQTSAEKVMKALSDLRHAIAHGGDGDEGVSFRASRINLSTITPYADLAELVAEKLIFDRRSS